MSEPMTKNRVEEISLEYQNYIEQPPVSTEQLFRQSTSSDATTIKHWKDTWIKNIKANHATHGPFAKNSLGQLFGKYQGQACILAGSGPSLGYNGHLLKDREGIPLISCLHNFHFFEDLEIDVDFYVSLDSGDITVSEVSEGGKKTEEEYWALTEKRTLLCYTGTSPKLLEKWRGKVLFFSCSLPDEEITKAQDELEVFNMCISNGGNVLGACLYISKAILGCVTTAFVGADFSFSYKKKFHAWDSSYDAKLGNVLKAVDVFGNKVLTWPSYYNFKCWFDCIVQNVPGSYFNCTEGGIFGAYAEGNLMNLRQMKLGDFLIMNNMNIKQIKAQCEDPTTNRWLLFG